MLKDRIGRGFFQLLGTPNGGVRDLLRIDFMTNPGQCR